MRKKLWFALIAAVVLTACGQQAKQDRNAEIEVGEEMGEYDQDKADLLIAVMIDNRLQAALSALAEEKSQNQTLVSFADRTVRELEDVRSKLLSVASAREIDTPEGLTPEAQAVVDQLDALTGVEFDRRYLELTVKLHDADIERLNEFQSGEAPILERSALDETRDFMTRHMEEAQSILNALPS